MPELLLAAKKFGKSLKTSYFSVAQAKLAEFLKEHRERVCTRKGAAESFYGRDH